MISDYGESSKNVGCEIINKTGNIRITNVTLRHLRVATVALEKQRALIITGVCNLSYPASKAHATYYIVVCGLPGSTIFFNFISQTVRLRKKCELTVLPSQVHT
jgi:hypothetical protein